MEFRNFFVRVGLILAIASGVFACTVGSGDRGRGGYEISVIVSGLNLNNTIVLHISANFGAYENTLTVTNIFSSGATINRGFGDGFGDGTRYRITVLTQPADQTCELSGGTFGDGSGIIEGDDANIMVTCTDNLPDTYTVGGTVSGLISGTLTLQNNGGDDLDITSNDPSFTFTTPIDDGQAYAVSVLTDPIDHTCTVTNESGTSSTNISNVTVTCVSSAAGALDTSFNTVGYITHHNAAGGSGGDFGNGVATDSSNNIFVVGQSHIGSMVIWKYDQNGTLDSSFGSGGIVTDIDAAGGTSAYGTAIAIDGSGNVFVTGAAVSGAPSFETRMVLWKYDAFGVPDNSFGTSGVFTTGDMGVGHSLIIDTSGVNDRIVVAGEVDTGFGTDMAIWRFDSDGSLDTTFDSDGIVTHDSAAGGINSDSGRSVTIDENDNIVVTGMSYNSSNNTDMIIWRYLPNGTLDSSFDGDGFYVNNGAAGGNSDDVGNAVKIDASNRIVVVGSSFSPASSTSGEEMAIWRYNPATNSLDNTFDSDGVVIYAGSDDDGGHGVVIDSQNRILVTGVMPNFSNSGDMALWRYTESGVLDTTFGASNTGLVTHHNAAGGDGWDSGSDITFDVAGRIVVVGNSRGTNDSDMAIWRYQP